MLAPGKILYFGTIKDTNRDWAHQSQNEDNFPHLFSRAGVLKREKNNGKGDLTSEPSRFALLPEGEIQQILTERHPGKTKQKTNWSVSTFKGKRKFFRFEIVKFKTPVLNRKIEIKPIPFPWLCLIRLQRTITSDIVGRFSRRI